MSSKLTDLQPSACKAAQESAAELKSSGIPFADTSTLRTEAEQWALWCQGRKPLAVVNDARRAAGMYSIKDAENSYTVTNCDGIKNKSAHQSGLAIDRVPANEKGQPIWPDKSDPRWVKISDVMVKYGFEWGGAWTRFPDFPHYEYKGGSK